MCVEAVASGDAYDGGGDEAGMGLQHSSNGCDRFSVVRCLACEGRGVADGSVLVPDFFPHVLAGGEGGGGEGVGMGRGEPLVPVSALGLVGAILRSRIVLREIERK